MPPISKWGGGDADLGPFGKMIRVTEKDVVAVKQKDDVIYICVTRPVFASFIKDIPTNSFCCNIDSFLYSYSLNRIDLIKDSPALISSFVNCSCSTLISSEITTRMTVQIIHESMLELFGDAIDADASGLKFELLTPEIADMDGFISLLIQS